MHMETLQPPATTAPSCPSCGATAAERVHHVAPHNGVRYTLNHCPCCQLEFWTPLAVDTSIYQDSGFSAYQDYHTGRRPFPRWAEPLFSVLPRSDLRTLDIGCGDGAVMARLQAFGAHVQGMDLDPQSVAVAESRCGAGTCTVSTLDQYVDSRLECDDRFDLVSFFEVLEHQVDPGKFLAQVARLVAPGGIVAGSVPDRDRFLAFIDRRVDRGDLPPHHHLWFSLTAMRSMLERAGFAEIEVIRTGAMGYGETLEKVRAHLAQRARELPAVWRPLSGPLAAIASPPLALAFWLGRKRRPSHLFFRCRA